MSAPLKLVLDGDTDVIVTRRFKAPPALVYRAHIDPELIVKWMLPMPDWSMPTCEVDARPGGHFRYVFEPDEGPGFRIEGTFVSLEPEARIVHVERMFLPDPTPDNNVDTRFDPDGDGTKMTMRMSLPSSETRAAMLETGMADGMEACFQLLEELSPSFAA